MSDLNINDLLDATLDDLEDLPEFKPFQPGIHRVLASLEFKEVNSKQAVELSFKLMETMELADASMEPQKEGSEASILFMLDNEFGRGNMKKLLKPFGESLGTGVIRDVIESTTNTECLIVTGYRKNKDDPSSPFMQVKEIRVL